MFRRLALIALAAVVLVGCGNKVNVGEVVDRDFEPAHEETYFTQVQTGQSCYSSGNPPVQHCTPIYMQVPHQRWEPDRWRIRIKGCKAEEGDFERHECDEKDRRWVTVDRDTYESVRNGDWYEVR